MRPIPDILATVAEAERADGDATPGPWIDCAVNPSIVEIETDDGKTIVRGMAPNDAAFIAHARTALPTLAADTHDLVGLLGRMAEALTESRAWVRAAIKAEAERTGTDGRDSDMWRSVGQSGAVLAEWAAAKGTP